MLLLYSCVDWNVDIIKLIFRISTQGDDFVQIQNKKNNINQPIFWFNRYKFSGAEAVSRTDMAKPRIAPSDAFAKISDSVYQYRHVCISVLPGRFHKIWRFSIFRQSVKKTRVSLKSDKNIRYFTRGSMYICDNISLSFSWNEKCPRHPLQTKSKHTFVVETFFIFFENRTVYGIMWKNVVDQGAPQLTTWRVHSTCWITMATDTPNM